MHNVILIACTNTAVIVLLLSPEVIFPTWCWPLLAITKPVSSTFHMCNAGSCLALDSLVVLMWR